MIREAIGETLLGMYVHMHWAYGHPYAARTWSPDDWSSYLSGLRELGCNLVQIWPMMDTMPVPLTPSDRAHLEKMGGVIDTAHSLGMAVFVGASANTIGNAKAADYDFESRPYFTTELRVDPADGGQLALLVEARRIFMEALAEADGFWIIDSDPGGFKGSSAAEFVEVFGEHRRLLDELKEGIRLFYWMWAGWQDRPQFSPEWRDKPQACWREALEGIAELAPDPWGILGCWPGHFATIRELGLTDRTLYFPYGIIENEPSFPWTGCDPERIRSAFENVPLEDYPLGVVGNAQTHCVQLPHTFLFRHFARGRPDAAGGLRGLGEGLLPGFGETLSRAWEALSRDDPAAMEKAVESLSGIPEDAPKGKLAGLCFGETDRLVEDLRAQLAVKLGVVRLREDVSSGADARDSFAGLVRSVREWSRRHGYGDRYHGPFKELVHPALREFAGGDERGEELRRALDDFDAGPHHGAFARLLEALEAVAAIGGA